jgi:hypothetical protein
MTSGVGLLPSARRRCAERYRELGGHPVCRAPRAASATPLLCGPQRVRGLFRLRGNCFGQLRSRNTSTCGTRRFVDRNHAYRMVRSARDASGCHIAGRNAGRPEDRGRRLTTMTWMVRPLQCRRGAFRETIEKGQRPAPYKWVVSRSGEHVQESYPNAKIALIK